MIVFLSKTADGVQVLAQVESKGIIGDVAQRLGPTDLFMGWTGAELAELGVGEFDLTDKAELIAEITAGSMDEESLQSLVDDNEK